MVPQVEDRPNMDFMSAEEERRIVKESLDAHDAAILSKHQEFAKEIARWKTANSLSVLLPEKASSVNDAHVQMLESFKLFFTKDGHQSEFLSQ